MQTCVICCINAAGEEYHRIAMLKGDTTLLLCNTTKSSGVQWTHNTTKGEFSYVYINGTIQGSFASRFSVEGHSLNIYNTHIGDSGCYVCYENDDVRRFGYELNVTGKKTVNNVTPIIVV